MNLESIKNMIRGLMDKTTGKGCTEAEANSAMDKAQKLMETYQLQMDDIFIVESNCIKFTANHNLYIPYVAIARFTNCKVWKSGKTINFFGLEPDVFMAEYLCDIIGSAIDTELNTYKLSSDYISYRGHRKRLTASFLNGMSNRLFARMNEMSQQVVAATSSVSALIIVKNKKVEDEFKDMGLRLVTKRSYHRVTEYGAYNSGTNAANKVNLNRPISAGSVVGFLC